MNSLPDSAFKVLEILERSSDPISGETISNELGISRSAVWKHIKELQGMGYEIFSSQKEGYKLTRTSNKLLPYEVHKKLKTQFIGKKMRYLDSTPSTIWVGKQMCAEGDVGKVARHGDHRRGADRGSGPDGQGMGLSCRGDLDHDRPQTPRACRSYLHDHDGRFHCRCPCYHERNSISVP